MRKAKKTMEDRVHELAKLHEELHTLLRKPRSEQVPCACPPSPAPTML